jgi:hypothetical protein
MRKRLLPLVLVVLLTIPLALALRDFARDVFVVELLRILWAGRILFESLPQWPMWVLLLIVLVIVAAVSLGRVSKPAQKKAVEEALHQGQVQVLARWIRRTSQGAYFRWSLAQYLGGLAWDVMAHRAHTTPRALKQRQRAGSLDLPPVVQDYLQAAQSPDFAASTGLLSRLRARLGRGASSTSYDPALLSVIQFLETQLEIPPPHPVTADTLEVQHDH